MVFMWLYNYSDKTLDGSVAYGEKASEIWTDLKEHYSYNNNIRRHQLKQEITVTKEGTLLVTNYFPELKELLGEL